MAQSVHIPIDMVNGSEYALLIYRAKNVVELYQLLS